MAQLRGLTAHGLSNPLAAHDGGKCIAPAGCLEEAQLNGHHYAHYRAADGTLPGVKRSPPRQRGPRPAARRPDRCGWTRQLSPGPLGRGTLRPVGCLELVCELPLRISLPAPHASASNRCGPVFIKQAVQFRWP